MSLRPAWSKDQVPGQPEVHTDKPCHMAIRGCPALKEEQTSIPSTHIEDAHTAPNYCYRDSGASSHLRPLHECALTHNTHCKISAEV